VVATGISRGTAEMLEALEMLATGRPTTTHRKAAGILTEVVPKVTTGGQTIVAKTAIIAMGRPRVPAKVVTAGMVVTEAIPLLEVIAEVSVTKGTTGDELIESLRRRIPRDDYRKSWLHVL